MEKPVNYNEFKMTDSIENFHNLDTELVIEVHDYLDHKNPENHYKWQQRIQVIGKAAAAGTILGLSVWMVSRGQNSMYEQFVNGLKGMSQ